MSTEMCVFAHNYYIFLGSSVIISSHLLLQLKMFEQMGFKVDRESPIYKRFRLKVLGAYFFLEQFVAVHFIYCFKYLFLDFYHFRYHPP